MLDQVGPGPAIIRDYIKTLDPLDNWMPALDWPKVAIIMVISISYHSPDVCALEGLPKNKKMIFQQKIDLE